MEEKFKRQKAPTVGSKQKIVQKHRLNTLAKGILPPSNPVDVVMDDESYFTFSTPDLPGNGHYYCNYKDKISVSDEVRFKFKVKFPPKLIFWIAISQRGKSALYFALKNCSLDAASYSSQCIVKRLVPFTNSKYPDGDYIFWPDGASCHYANYTLAILEQNDIHYIK